MPKKTETTERFEVPEVETTQLGNRTIIKNFEAIADKLNRDKKHLSKYLSKELATSGNIESGRLILNSKKTEKIINEKINDYVKEFVICKQCKRPDTKLVEYERGIYIMISEACGARSPVSKV